MQIAGAGLKETSPPFARLRRRFLLERLQIGKIGHTIGTLDHLEMKFDIVLLLFIKHLQQITTELFTRRAGEAFASPDSAERMFTAIAFLHGLTQRPA